MTLFKYYNEVFNENRFMSKWKWNGEGRDQNDLTLYSSKAFSAEESFSYLSTRLSSRRRFIFLDKKFIVPFKSG